MKWDELFDALQVSGLTIEEIRQACNSKIKQHKNKAKMRGLKFSDGRTYVSLEDTEVPQNTETV